MPSERKLTADQFRTLKYLVYWDKEYGGLCSCVDGRSATALKRRGWVENAVDVSINSVGQQTCQMCWVVTAEGRQAYDSRS